MERSGTALAARLAGVLTMVAALTACASFDGTPRPVITSDHLLDLARGKAVVRPLPAANDRTGGIAFGIDDALAHAAGTETPEELRAYRDAFIGVQIAAIDAQYQDFRTRLAVQAKTVNFGLDLGILALTGTGAVVGKQAANILSAGGSGLTGAKASFNREVLFDKALPALVASMDARRLTVKTTIAQKMQLPVDGYPIPAAIADLSAYQMAASLDGAIDQITKDAAINRDVAQDRYDDAVHVCVVEDGVTPIWTRIGSYLDSLTADQKTKLDIVSDIVGSPKDVAFDTERTNVANTLATKYCSLRSAQNVLNRLQAGAGLEFR